MTEFRSGIGIDVHKLINGESLILGGVAIEHEFGLLGHSDGDVLTHSIIDSILGASGLGDIGSLFPSTDEQYRDISSMVLLKKTVSLAHKSGWIVKFLDATIVAQRPKILPHVELMKTALSEVLVVSEKSVNIKATTTDGLGFIGNEQGIASLAIVSLEAR
tara:strand:+ start:1388 stop:1870 length:483 start_codon:yes stop_codon:yes gene_type:complete